MGIDYSVALGVGVDNDEITYENLTEYGKDIIRDIYLNAQSLNAVVDEQEVSDWFIDNIAEYDLYYELGLSTFEGNLYSGWVGMRGVGFNLSVENIAENVEKAKQRFKKVVKLEPEMFCGVLVS